MNKKYVALNNELEKTLANFDSKILRLKESRAKTAEELAKAKEERAAALETGALEKARKLRPTVTDLESDLESYTFQIERAETEKKKTLEEMAHSFSLQVRKIESEQRAKNAQDIAPICADLYQRLEELDADRSAGVEILRHAQNLAGLPLSENYSYFAILGGKRLLAELFRVTKAITDYNAGRQVYGVADPKDWL